MNLAKVLGELVSTKKNKNLTGYKLYVIQQIDHKGKNIGKELISIDTVGSRIGDTVIYTTSREAAQSIPENFTPVDASIIAIVDHIYQDKDGRE